MQLCLQPEDFGRVSNLLQENFGNRIVFGYDFQRSSVLSQTVNDYGLTYRLEGGYSLTDLPLAIKETILPFCEQT